jgi:hypothetical protein
LLPPQHWDWGQKFFSTGELSLYSQYKQMAAIFHEKTQIYLRKKYNLHLFPYSHLGPTPISPGRIKIKSNSKNHQFLNRSCIIHITHWTEKGTK